MSETEKTNVASSAQANRQRAPGESTRVDTLRGLGCILVVAFHAIGAESHTGLHVPDSSAYRGFCNLLMHVRMPLFAFLSGYVYSLWPVAPGCLAAFVQKKMRRLVIPLLTVTSIYYLLTKLLPYDKAVPAPAEFWRIYLFPFAQFWFLQAMILIFALVAVLDGFKLLDRIGRYWLAYGLAVLGCIGVRVQIDLFSIDHMLELLPFFLLGLGVVRFRSWLAERRTGTVCLLVWVALMGWYAFDLFVAGGPMIPKRTAFSLLLGTSGVLALLHWFPSMSGLAFIGRSSFAIFLYHAFFTAGTRQAMAAIGFSTMRLMEFSLSLLAGVAGPMVVEYRVGRIPWLAGPLLGQAAPLHETAHATR